MNIEVVQTSRAWYFGGRAILIACGVPKTQNRKRAKVAEPGNKASYSHYGSYATDVLILDVHGFLWPGHQLPHTHACM